MPNQHYKWIVPGTGSRVSTHIMADRPQPSPEEVKAQRDAKKAAKVAAAKQKGGAADETADKDEDGAAAAV
jgi:hypothetical protein